MDCNRDFTGVGRDIKTEGGDVYISFVSQQSEEQIKDSDLTKESPYKGLKRFELQDKHKFFGREKLIDNLSEYLEKEDLLLLLGASGSGKSSLVRAGLIPKLGDKFVNLTFVPDEEPFESLYACLVNKYGIAKAKIAREGKADTLVQIVKTLQQDSQWLIFIDQFEQLFTRSRKEKCEKFINSIIQLITKKNSSVKIILAMRSDFLDEFSPYHELGKIHDHHSRMVTDMTESELRLAIAEPAARNGVTFEKGLVEQIISDFYKQPGSLPLLQYTLDLLWKTDEPSENNRVLNVATYQDIGGVSGALQKHVNEIYQNLSSEQQLATKQILLRLVDVVALEKAEVLRTMVSRRAYKSEFSEAQTETINFLVDQSLLVSDDPTLKREGQSTVEIAHEALLTSWVELKDWITDARETISLNNRLAEDANHWQELKRINPEQANEELWSGSKLEKVREFRKDGTFEVVLGGLSEIANEFIDTSIDLRDRLIKEKLAAAQKLAKESEARRMAEAQAREAAEKAKEAAQELAQAKSRENKKLRFRSLIAITFGIAASILGISSLFTSQKAELKEQAANLQVKYSLSNEIEHLLESIQLVGDNQKFNKRWFRPENGLIPEVQSILYQAVEYSRERYVFDGYESEVNSVAFSPDGKYLVSGSRDNTIKLWDIDRKTLLQAFDGHESGVNSVGFSPNGQYIVSGSSDNTIKLWDRSNNTLVHTFNGHQFLVNSVVFSPDGQYIASGSSDNTVKLWDVDKKELVDTFNGHESGVNAVAFSPDGKYLLSGSSDNTIKLWDRSNNTLVHTFKDHESEVNSVVFSPDGKYLVSGSNDKTVKLWDIDQKTLVHTFNGYKEAIKSVVFSPDGQYIVSGSNDNMVKLWRVEDKVLRQSFNGHESEVNSVVFSPDGQYIVSGSKDNTIKLWDGSNQVLLHSFEDHEAAVNSVDFSPDGQYIVSGSRDNTIKLWDAQKQVLLHSFAGHESWVNSVDFNPDGQYIVSGSRDKTIKLWDRSSQVLLHSFAGHESGINSVDFSSNGQYIVSGSNDKTVKLWDRSNQVLLHSFAGHEAAVNSVDFSPDGQYIVSGSYDKTVKLWDMAQKKLVHTFKDHESGVNSVDFSPDGQYIVSGSYDKTVKFWDMAQKKLVHTFEGHESGVNFVVFSPDSQYIVSGSYDKTVKLWNVEAQILLHTFTGSRQVINSVGFSPDGQYIVSGSSDLTVKLWRGIDWQDWVKVGCERIRLHPALVYGNKSSAQVAATTCLEYGRWCDSEKAEFKFLRSKSNNLDR